MPIEKIVVVDCIEVLENGCVQIKTKTTLTEDGAQLSSIYHRHVIAPGDDYSGEDARVKTICAVVHTPEVIAKFKAESSAKGI